MASPLNLPYLAITNSGATKPDWVVVTAGLHVCKEVGACVVVGFVHVVVWYVCVAGVFVCIVVVSVGIVIVFVCIAERSVCVAVKSRGDCRVSEGVVETGVMHE